jgi:hypothetical protein
MKINKIYEQLQDFANKLGDKDFTVSLALCETKCYISVSCHSSKKYQFDHGGLQRTAEIGEDAMETDISVILDDLVDKYKECLEERQKSEDLEDAIKRAKKVSKKTSRKR